MGVASLILGIISLIIGFIPFCGIIAVLPAIIGLILGIVEVVNKKKAGEPKGKGIAGLICSAIAIVVIISYFVIAGVLAKRVSEDADLYNEALMSSNGIKELIDEEANSMNFYDANGKEYSSILDFIESNEEE